MFTVREQIKEMNKIFSINFSKVRNWIFRSMLIPVIRNDFGQ
ncbi:hypothetical protein ADIS_1336 [Lunatimonas lonarensis]|uniref:Uncharacterized protein n=1 Tax=Lunatimonas lonarensis TaxID=1232681 RepID=R7ZVX3_9BACT|nr:hypothetical protein ADIS_1336 [Lunatimonas lonarensis]